ncbi:YbgC/FadM family acyl-CoA thioesterase [uncultured Campylobacter sp.]|uniref:YbgC/FadM family acyl-CoA thioesterase n=1 Tax=uncultured Campylobacter sp. TaxID=218934 RepID=UPI0026057780|nr:YbgC/FadM family acyl-CoA thioesterase [uncultured Campylobacter sp.]
MQIKIYYEDTDAQGIVYHANYIKFCERARSEALMQTGVDFARADTYFVVSELFAKFLRPARLGDTLEIRTSLAALKNASALLRQEIYKIKDIKNTNFSELLYAQDVKIAFVKEGRPIKFNAEILEFFKSLK